MPYDAMMGVMGIAKKAFPDWTSKCYKVWKNEDGTYGAHTQ
jgi:hypothetical protein